MPFNFVNFIKLILGASPWAAIGLLYASIIYFKMPNEFKNAIGLFNSEYTLTKIFGVVFILSSGFALSFFTKFLVQKTPLLIKKVVAYRKTRIIISELLRDKLATTVLLKIKGIELDLQEDSDTLGQPIEISLTNISSGIDDSGGMIEYYISKLRAIGFLKIGAFGEIFGVSNKGLDFLVKNKLLK